MITRGSDFPHVYAAYDPALPPPLCFTVPAGQGAAPAGSMIRSGSMPVRLSTERKMADPSDSTTWQRQYRFT